MTTYCPYFPRSGGNYLIRNYSHHIRQQVIHTHDAKYLSEDSVFSVIRNPADSLSSIALLSMLQTIEKWPDKLSTDEDRLLFLKRSIEQYADDYVSFYTNSHISTIPICNFEDVVSDIVRTCWKLSSLLGHEGQDFEPSLALDRDNFTATSRTLEYVDLSDAAVKEVDLSSAFGVYNEVLSITI